MLSTEDSMVFTMLQSYFDECTFQITCYQLEHNTSISVARNTK